MSSVHISGPSDGPLHPHEADRLESLRSYGVLDTPPEPVYDNLARVAAQLCETPMAALTLLDADRSWVRARHGIDINELPRGATFCEHVVAHEEPIVLADAQADPRFAAAAARGVRAYAGVPLIGRDGLPLGALCVLDSRPRRLDEQVVEWLHLLAEQAVGHMELQRTDHRAGLAPAFHTEVRLRPERVRAALDAGELVPWFQPIVDLATGRACGAEALLRWEHPLHGTIAPGAFLPMLEATGLILPTGREVLRRSLRALRCLYDRGLAQPPYGISVNVSAHQASQPGFARTVLAELDRAGVAPTSLTLELTETGGSTPIDIIRTELEQVRAAGVRIDADDFGNGYSTIQRLLDLPLTGLKLDLSLVSQVPHDHRVARVVQWLVRGARDLGLTVTAEGVETEAQRDFLREVGCDRAQGYLFGRAVAELVG